MCFAWILEQTAIISLYKINLSVFITKAEIVSCAVWARSPNQKDAVLSLNGYIFLKPVHEYDYKRLCTACLGCHVWMCVHLSLPCWKVVVAPYHLAMKSEAYHKHGLLIYKKHTSVDKSTKKSITECDMSQNNIKMCVCVCVCVWTDNYLPTDKTKQSA